MKIDRLSDVRHLVPSDDGHVATPFRTGTRTSICTVCGFPVKAVESASPDRDHVLDGPCWCKDVLRDILATFPPVTE